MATYDHGRDELPQKYEQLLEIFDSICGLLVVELEVEQKTIAEREKLFSDFEEAFLSGAWCFEPKTKLVSDAEIDRLGEVIMGPIFTSDHHPWPYHNDLPMSPLLQLDLDNASNLGGISLGGGFLQVWMPHDCLDSEQFIRVIPRSAISQNQLLPIVEIPDELHVLQKRDRDWKEEANQFEYVPAYQIVGYAEKRFTVQISHTIQDNFNLENLTSSSQTKKRIKEFDKYLKPLLKNGNKGISPNSSHLFGTFRQVSYGASEKPTTLFCFEESDFGLMWGSSGGNAQVFFEFDHQGKPIFSFDWST
jgi:hypothetical protein